MNCSRSMKTFLKFQLLLVRALKKKILVHFEYQ